jgi:hypothetical protein
MKYKAEFIFDAPEAMVWEAREKRFEHPERFPELQKQELMDRKEDGDVIKQKRKIELSASVPKALRTVLPAEMLKCIDESVYDRSKGTHHFVVKPNFKTDVFTCKGFSKYEEFEEGGKVKTKRYLELDVIVKVPIVGRKAEEVILDGYKKNVLRDNDSITEMVEMMKKEKGA